MRNQRGFTLIELLVVIAVCGIIAAVIALNVGSFLGSQNGTEGETTAYELVTEGVLTEFGVSAEGWRIGFGSDVFVLGSQYRVIYDNPVCLGSYYFLYRDTIGGITISTPYKLTQEELDGIQG